MRNGLRLGIVVVLLSAITFSPEAWSKKKEAVKPLPLFMASDFSFSQIDSICVAQLLDLRSDKSAPIFLAGDAPSIPFDSHTLNATEVLNSNLVALGYNVTSCGPVNATLGDLSKPSETWLHSLKFGSSRWLLVVAVEEVVAKEYPSDLNPFHRDYWPSYTIPRAPFYDAGHAVVSGYLFANLQGSPKLVWRDSTLGLQFSGIVKGSGGADVSSVEAVDNAVANIAWRFDGRSNKRPPIAFNVAEENVNRSCDVVWKALKDALNQDPNKYRVALSDEADMMILYTLARRTAPENNDHIALKNQPGACVMQFTQASVIGRTDDWGDLTKRMRDLIAKPEAK